MQYLIDLVQITKANEPFYKIDVWLGKENFVQSYTKEDIFKTIKKAKKKLLKVSVKYDGPVEAPINKGDKIKVDFKTLGKINLDFI